MTALAMGGWFPRGYDGQRPRDWEQATTCSLEAVLGWNTSS